jgi:nucleoside-diphosphate-sugar epimerase
VELRFAFGPGFPEHTIHVRGAAGSATVDFERNTYVIRRAAGRGPDFDRYASTTGEGRALVRQGRGNLIRYALAALRLARDGNAFGGSIRRSLATFYASLPGQSDSRLAPALGREVVTLCRRIGEAAGVRLEVAPPPLPVVSAPPADVLVLGGTGFIGRALIRCLLEQGRRVRLLTRDPAGLPCSLRGLPLDVVPGDLTAGNFGRTLEGVPCVYHLARSVTARTWDEYVRQDLAPTRSLAEACICSGVRRLIYTGTIDSYYTGNPNEVIDERTPLDPGIECRNPYARCKAEAEKWLLQLHRESGLAVVLVRPGIVIGPGGSPYHWGVGYWPSESVCRFWGDGTHPLPFVLAGDVARGLALMADAAGIEGESFNLVSEPCLDARGYVAALAEATGTRIDARPVPAWRTYLGDVGKWAVKCLTRHPRRSRRPSYRDWQTRCHRARFDCSKAKQVLGWSPYVGRERLVGEGVRRAAAAWQAGHPRPDSTTRDCGGRQ